MTDEQIQDVLKRIEYLVHINHVYLRKHEETPRLTESGVRLRHEASEMVSDIPRMLRDRMGEFESFVAWRIAELRRSGIVAEPYFLKRPDQHFRLVIRLLDQQFEVLEHNGRFERKTESELHEWLRGEKPAQVLGSHVMVRAGEPPKTCVMWQGDGERVTITLAPAAKAGRGYARIKFGNSSACVLFEVDLLDTAQIFDVRADLVVVDLGVDKGSAISEQPVTASLSFEERSESLPIRGKRTRYVDHNGLSVLINVPVFATAIRSDTDYGRRVQMLDASAKVIAVADVRRYEGKPGTPLPNDCVSIRSTGGVPHSLSFDIVLG